MKGFSVITNFGCKQTCPYCIWKKHSLKNIIQNDNMLLNRIFEELSKRVPDITKFSLSGGGDPLHDFDKHFEFWKELFKICNEFNIELDIHTSYNIVNILYNSNFEFAQKFSDIINRIVYHADRKRFDSFEIFKLARNFSKVRINFVVTSDLDIDYLINVEEVIQDLNIQLSYRELVNNDNSLKPSQDVLKFCQDINKRYCFGRFVEQDDYNDYLMPNGIVYSKFLE